MSKEFRADVHLVHVFERNYPLPSTAAASLIMPELKVGKLVRRRLKDIADDYSIELRRENLHAMQGRPFEQICALARDSDIDLIIIATRGNTGLKHVLLGSTAERVVRYSPCPVLVVRGDEDSNTACFNGQRTASLGFRKILVPIDFSDCSMKGLNYAKALAKHFDAKLILLHSVYFQYYVTGDEYARYDFPQLMQQAEKTAKEQMRDLVRHTDWGATKVETSLQIGHVGQQICDRAKEFGSDLIVTSTHGRTGLSHMLIGSTAEYVVRHAQCPVLVVPSHERPILK